MGNSLDKFNDLEESLREERNRIVAQNGNDGLHYEDGESLSQEDFDYNIAKTRKADTNEERKATPIFSGFISYFPNAIKDVARLSLIANSQHHPDKPLHWDMNKSKDELDSCMRHLIDYASGVETDDDGVLHLAKCAWRMMAMLERTLTDKLD